MREQAVTRQAAREARIRDIGPAMTPEAIQAVWELFAEEHRLNGYQAPAIGRDIAYGPDERHRLDVHAPATPAPAAPAASAPVLLFVHGGGFVGGDKRAPGMPYYDHVGGWAAARGLVAVTMTYRLAPQHPWPAGAEDVAAAVTWVRENIAGHGGDPGRVVVAGHSAGAAHVAGYLAGHGARHEGSAARRSGGEARDETGGGEVAAAALLSGIYDLATAEPGELLRAYFGADTGTYPERSPLPGLLASPVPVMFSVAEMDPTDFQRQAAGVVDAFFQQHLTVPPFAWIHGHNHVSEIVSLGVDDGLGAPLGRFIERACGPARQALPR